MIDVANFKADPTYTICDEIVTVGGRVLNSRNAFRAQSQLICNAERPWGIMTAHGVATKPQDVRSFFFYPPLDFETGDGKAG